ncbi:hypothetical protein DL93DRAFT_2080483 [Clavulina sp. PMI_390]|nr:hypothetical protein DL93DRAFT_2080483 [Clavulina sp. PMI_390]
MNGDPKRDYLSREASLLLRTNGVYTVKGSEDKGRLTWQFTYLVDDRRDAGGEKMGGEKMLTPLSFSCAPELLSLDRGRKVGLLQVAKKALLSKLIASKIEPPALSPTSAQPMPSKSALPAPTAEMTFDVVHDSRDAGLGEKPPPPSMGTLDNNEAADSANAKRSLSSMMSLPMLRSSSRGRMSSAAGSPNMMVAPDAQNLNGSAHDQGQAMLPPPPRVKAVLLRPVSSHGPPVEQSIATDQILASQTVSKNPVPPRSRSFLRRRPATADAVTKHSRGRSANASLTISGPVSPPIHTRGPHPGHVISTSISSYVSNGSKASSPTAPSITSSSTPLMYISSPNLGEGISPPRGAGNYVRPEHIQEWLGGQRSQFSSPDTQFIRNTPARPTLLIPTAELQHPIRPSSARRSPLASPISLAPFQQPTNPHSPPPTPLKSYEHFVTSPGDSRRPVRRPNTSQEVRRPTNFDI